MELWKAIVMGIIQGLAEFLPISSSGHLAIFKHILNIDLETGGILFDVLLHVGTLAAIFVAFWKDIRKLVLEGFSILGDSFVNAWRFVTNLFSKEKREYRKVVSTAYRKLVMLVIVSTIPTGILGLLLSDTVERASATLIVPGICLVITAVLLFVADRAPNGTKRPNQISYLEAAAVGVAQGIATLPGISRSGATITACRVLGFDKNFAVKYSFLMSIPAVMGAAVLELRDFASAGIDGATWASYLAGAAIAAVVGYVSIKTMLVIVRKKSFRGFSYYCLLVGAIAILWNFLGQKV